MTQYSGFYRVQTERFVDHRGGLSVIEQWRAERFHARRVTSCSEILMTLKGAVRIEVDNWKGPLALTAREVRNHEGPCHLGDAARRSFVLSRDAIHNEAWTESLGTADWVPVTAVDEHLALAGGGDQRAHLEGCRRVGVTAVPVIGYQMVSWTFPRQSRRLARGSGGALRSTK